MVAEMEEDMAAAIDAEGDGMTEERRDMYDRFLAFMLDLTDLSPPRLYATVQLFVDRKLDSIAKVLGCTFQNVHALQRESIREIPLLGELRRHARKSR